MTFFPSSYTKILVRYRQKVTGPAVVTSQGSSTELRSGKKASQRRTDYFGFCFSCSDLGFELRKFFLKDAL